MRAVITRSSIRLIALGVVFGSAATLLTSYLLHSYRPSKVAVAAYDSSSISLMLGSLRVGLDDDIETVRRNASAAGLALETNGSPRYPELKRVRVYRQATADDLATAIDLLKGALLADNRLTGLRNMGFTLGYIDTFKGRVFGADRSVEQETLFDKILITQPGAESPDVRAALSLWKGLNNLRQVPEVSPAVDVPLDAVELRSSQMVELDRSYVEAEFRHGDRFVEIEITRPIGSALCCGSYVTVTEGIKDVSRAKAIGDEIERQRATK